MRIPSVVAAWIRHVRACAPAGHLTVDIGLLKNAKFQGGFKKWILFSHLSQILYELEKKSSLVTRALSAKSCTRDTDSLHSCTRLRLVQEMACLYHSCKILPRKHSYPNLIPIILPSSWNGQSRRTFWNSCTELLNSWTGHSECLAIAHFTNWATVLPSSWTGQFHRLGVTYILWSRIYGNDLFGLVNDQLNQENGSYWCVILNVTILTRHQLYDSRLNWLPPQCGSLVVGWFCWFCGFGSWLVLCYTSEKEARHIMQVRHCSWAALSSFHNWNIVQHTLCNTEMKIFINFYNACKWDVRNYIFIWSKY